MEHVLIMGTYKREKMGIDEMKSFTGGVVIIE